MDEGSYPPLNVHGGVTLRKPVNDLRIRSHLLLHLENVPPFRGSVLCWWVCQENLFRTSTCCILPESGTCNISRIEWKITKKYLTNRNLFVFGQEASTQCHCSFSSSSLPQQLPKVQDMSVTRSCYSWTTIGLIQ